MTHSTMSRSLDLCTSGFDPAVHGARQSSAMSHKHKLEETNVC